MIKIKRILLLALFIAFIQDILAQNTLHLFTTDGSLFKITYKNKLVNKNAQAEIMLENCSQDTVNLKVEFENKSVYGLTLYLLEHGQKTQNKEFDYMLEPIKKGVKVIFVGIYDAHTYATSIVPKKPSIDTSTNYRNKVLGYFCELKDGKATYFNNLPKQATCVKAMPEENLKYLDLLMVKAQSPTEKVIIAENTFRNNCVSSEQINAILKYVDYELDKLKLIKLAYFNLTDTINKKKLESSFRFESSLSELNTFLKNGNDFKIKKDKACTNASAEKDVMMFAEGLAVFSNDNQRLSTLKKGYENYCFSIEQIRTVLKLFIHDREKLESAKRLYYNCVDKSNYLVLLDEFSYKESSLELREFLLKQEK